jgi:uncharacterized protein YlxW (UPF0749 family)
MRRGPSGAAAAVALAILGFLSVQAASQEPDVRARSIRRLGLADLIQEQDDRVRGLQEEVRRLNERVDRLRPEDPGIRDLLERIEALSVLAGGGALEGPGVIVTLDDSSLSRSPSGDPNDLVVHEEDIQAVVNALWAAGAEAVAVNGERLTSTSAVRCAGNTLLLHGSVHSPPYEIAAIGAPERLERRVLAEPGMERLRAAVRTFGIELDVVTAPVRIPERTVIRPLARAHPVR